MPPTPNKLNLSFTRNAYSVFGSRNAATVNEHQREQKTELLEGKKQGRNIYHIIKTFITYSSFPTNSSRGHWYRSTLNKRAVPFYLATLPRLSSTITVQFPFSLIPLVIWRDRSYKGHQRHRCRQKRAAFCTRLLLHHYNNKQNLTKRRGESVGRTKFAIGEWTFRTIGMRMASRCNDIGVISGARANGLLHLKNGVDYINPGEEDQMEIYG